MKKELIVLFFLFLQKQVWPRFVEIVKTPFASSEIIWIIAPLIISILLIQLYFGRWKNEKLGWNSVLGNIVVLLFITIGLMSKVFTMYEPHEFFQLGPAFYNGLLIVFLILQILLITIFVFLHSIHRMVAFFIGSQITVFTIAFVSISLVYGRIPFDFVTFVAVMILFLVVQLFFAFIRYLVPPSQEAKHFLIMKEKKRRKLNGIKKRAKTLKRHTLIKHIKNKVNAVKEKLSRIKI